MVKQAIASPDGAAATLPTANGPAAADHALLDARGVVKHFPLPSGFFSSERPKVHALNTVDLTIRHGEAFCVVGESGCGKTTLGRIVMGLLTPTEGAITFNGVRIDNLSASARKPFRRRMQMVFQNPYASLNPRMTVAKILEEPLRFHRPELADAAVRETVERVMMSVGNDPAWLKRYPHEFSGGQRQRISIARALMVEPEFIVADEPISALDVSIQAQVLNVMMAAKAERGLTYLFITHDLAVVEHIASRVAVMYLGRICEVADREALFAAPQHPYTRVLLDAIPRMDASPPRVQRQPGDVPSPVNLPPGCAFHGRCPLANDRCRREVPSLMAAPNGAKVACHAVEEGRG